MRTTRFGSREVGDGHPVFVTFEAGPTHDGLRSAMRLIDHAAAGGADAVKFQILDPDRLVDDRSVLFEYEVLVDRETGATERVSEPLYDLLARRALDRDEWRTLKQHADSLGLAFFATVGFDDEVDFMVDIGCESIKIASADVNHLPLIRRAARTGVCLQLDTGSSNLGEIETAVDTIRAEGNDRIIIHQCPTGYPARLESINLKMIVTLRQMFPYPVAYSDHTPGWEMDVAAVALGANLVEKTITEDRTTRSVEHVMSLEPAEMSSFVRVIRDVETALGSARRSLQPAELERRRRVRRSAFVMEDAAEGTPIVRIPIEFRRPGDGVGPDELDRMTDARLARDLRAGTKLKKSDLTW